MTRITVDFQQNSNPDSPPKLSSVMAHHTGISTRLIWTIGDEGISIRDLRTTNDESFFEPKTTSLDASHIMPAKTCRPYVWILLRGDILKTTLIVDDNLAQKHRLARKWNGY